MVDEENPELTAEDFARMRPAREALPQELVAVLPARKRGERGPGRAPKGKQRTVRLWPEVADAFPSGEGSNTRINQALLAYVHGRSGPKVSPAVQPKAAVARRPGSRKSPEVAARPADSHQRTSTGRKAKKVF
ncbi:MAG: BrnA antitoxin family protein [Casimicrobiaceae bacterium]